MMSSGKLLPIVLGLLAALLFGLATPAAKLLLGNLNPFLLAGLLYLGAAAGVSPIIVREKHPLFPVRPSSNKQFAYIGGAVIFGGLCGPALLMLGLSLAHASSVAIWLNMELVATAVLGVLFFKDNLDKKGWFGVALAFIAGCIITVSEGQSGWLPALLVTLACVCWGLDNHFTSLIDCATPSRITLYKGIFAGSANIVLGFIADPVLPAGTTIFKALILGAISYGASIVFYVMSAHHLGATRSQIIFSTSPLFGVLLAVLLLGEEFLFSHMLSLGFLGGAIYYSNSVTHSHVHTHEKLSHTHMHRHDDGHHDHAHDNIEHNHSSHTHEHCHSTLTHTHPHHPDLHHRHDHQ